MFVVDQWSSLFGQFVFYEKRTFVTLITSANVVKKIAIDTPAK